MLKSFLPILISHCCKNWKNSLKGSKVTAFAIFTKYDAISVKYSHLQPSKETRGVEKKRPNRFLKSSRKVFTLSFPVSKKSQNFVKHI